MSDLDEFITNMSPNQEHFLKLYEEANSIETRKKLIMVEEKNLRKRVKLSGFSLSVWDYTRKQAAKTTEQRKAEANELTRNLDWLGLLPDGYQIDMFDQTAQPAEIRAANEHGLAVGRSGGSRNDNPHDAGTAAYNAWDMAWFDGQQQLAERSGRARPHAV